MGLSFTRLTDFVSKITAQTINELQQAIEGHDVLLAPGNPGELKGTNSAGTSITNIKPGRIDARVRGMSPSNSNDSTLLTTLLRESSSTGAEVWLPEGTYNASITIDNTMNGAVLRGRGVLRGVGGASPLILNGDATNGHAINGFIFEGITFDGAGVNGCVNTTGSGPIDRVQFLGCRFRNTAASGSSGFTSAIRDSSGSRKMRIERCIFEATVGGGPNIISPETLHIINNVFEGTLAGNFITVTLYAGEPYSNGGDGIIISGNIGRNGKRMAVEIFANGAGLARGIVVTDNWFDVTGGAYGISAVGCESSLVSGNTVIGSDTYGLEIGVGHNVITENTIIGWKNGVILNNSASSIVDGNSIYNCNTGVTTTTSNAGASVAGIAITNNQIYDPRDYGILLGVGASGVNGADRIEHNTIWRTRVDADDNTRSFIGIQSSVPTIPGRRINHNVIVQAAAAPTLQQFYGINLTGTNTVRTRVEENTIINLASTPFGLGVGLNGGAPSAAGMFIHRNHFQNLATPLDGASQAAGTISMQGNTTSAIPGGQGDNRGLYSSVALGPAKMSEITTFPGQIVNIRGHVAGLPVYGDGYFVTGDILVERSAVSGGPLLYVNTANGQPGTWKKAAPLIEHLTNTATLDFPSIAAGTTGTLTITVTGAAVGDAVYLGPPATLEAGLVATGYVSAANTVTVRLANVTTGAIDPASATWRATVLRPS